MSQNYQILKSQNNRVIVELDIYMFKQIKETYQLQPSDPQQKQDKKDQDQKFQRRVVPFFMNQFMHWAKRMKYEQVVCYLKLLQNRKTSKQQKWELGDLQKIFGPINFRTKIIQTETQQRWTEFLSCQAELCVIINSKIKDQIAKGKYIDAIQLLKQELNKEQPYYKFLSLNTLKNEQSEISTQQCLEGIFITESQNYDELQLEQYSTNYSVIRESNESF